MSDQSTISTSKKIEAVTRPFIGKTLTTKMVQALVLEAYPETKKDNILPSDFAGPNSKGHQNSSTQLFERLPEGWRVLPEPIRRTSKKSAMTMDEALKAAKALLVAPAPAAPKDKVRIKHPVPAPVAAAAGKDTHQAA